MKYAIIALLLSVTISIHAQSDINLGGGYFGHTLSHPGVVLEAEIVSTMSTNAALLARAGLGIYTHPRHDVGAFLEVDYGIRRQFQSGLFLEETIGLGVLASWLNSDGVYAVADDGTVAAAGRRNPVDLMPSVSVGIGYNYVDSSSVSNLIWVRPKLYWRFPHKRTSTFVPVIQVGITRTIGSLE